MLQLPCAAAFLVLTCVATYAEPRSAKDCAAIDESFAYNDCIAKFGPPAKQTSVKPDPGAIMATAPSVAPTALGRAAPVRAGGRGSIVPAAPTPPMRVGGSIVQRRANGRVFTEFRIGPTVQARAPVQVVTKTLKTSKSSRSTNAAGNAKAAVKPQGRYGRGGGRRR